MRAGIGNQITEGVIWKQLLVFFFPILFGTFFQQLYNTVDMVVVGRFLGTEALASVGGSSGQIVNLVVGFFTGLSAGAGVVISQHYGAENREKVNDAIHTAYAFSIAGGVFFGILGIAASPAILRLMNTPAEIMDLSVLYLRIYFGGILFVFLYNVGSGILRALGNAKLPLYFLIVCCVVNILLDLLMVVGFGMGVAGVALATVAAQGISAALVTITLLRSRVLCEFHLSGIRFHAGVFRAQLHLGIPGGLQSVMYSFSNIIVQAAVNVYGTQTAAAWSADSKLEAIFWMISGAFGVSITTFVGQNYGAGKLDRVLKGTRVCLWMDQGASILISVLLVVFARPLFGIFTTDPEVLEIGVTIVRMIAPFYVVFSFIEILSSTLRGVSDVVIPMFLTMAGVCVLRILWILVLLPRHASLETIILNYPVTWVVTAALFLLYYHRKTKILCAPGGKSGKPR